MNLIRRLIKVVIHGRLKLGFDFMNLEKIKKLTNINFVWFLVSDLFYWGGSGVINTFLGVLVATRLTEGDLSAVGMTIFAFQLSNALFGIPLSILTNKFSFTWKKNIVGFGYLIYGLLIIGLT